ncbi:MAG TPA: hypothetical protein VK681_39315 [Reyranella sp.]|nr:hypothetical protein [Reyranella sp.]
MITFRPNTSSKPMLAQHVDGKEYEIQRGDSGTLTPEKNEVRCECPRCGSPYLAALGPDDPKYGDSVTITFEDVRLFHDNLTGAAIPFTRVVDRALPGFSCTAGDCGYTGVARRN